MVPQSPLKYSSTLLSSANRTAPSKREEKKKPLSSGGGFRPASRDRELHSAFLISVLLVLSLKWPVWRSAARGTLPVSAAAAQEDGWCYVHFKPMVIPSRNLGSATAPGFSFSWTGAILRATLKRCMETAGSLIPTTLHCSIFHWSPHLWESLLLQLDVQ